MFGNKKKMKKKNKKKGKAKEVGKFLAVVGWQLYKAKKRM